MGRKKRRKFGFMEKRRKEEKEGIWCVGDGKEEREGNYLVHGKGEKEMKGMGIEKEGKFRLMEVGREGREKIISE